MKTRIAIITLILGVFFAGSAMANMPVPASEDATNDISKYLKKNLTYPNFASESNLECSVIVSLIVQEDGSLKVDAANCVNCCMRDHVVKEINSLKKEDFKKYADQNLLVKVKYNLY